MHYVIALFVIVGLTGVVALLMDGDHNLFGFGEISKIVKEFKQEEGAFAEFCKEQKERDDAKAVAPAQVQQVNVQNNTAKPVTTAAPAPAVSSNSLFGNTASGVSFNPRPFGNNDFQHLGDYKPSAPVRQAPAGPVAQSSASSSNVSQAQQMKSSSNPIIRTWAGYVSMIEDAAK